MEQLTEEEISLVLDTYMYMEYHGAQDGDSVSEILTQMEKMEEYCPGGKHYGEYQILSQAAQNEQIGNLQLYHDSRRMGFDSGTNACTFVDREQNRVFVAYRGTGDGEWPDNGLGLTQEFTTQQQRAVDYFDRVVQEEELDGSQRVIVTGHSKGGNKAVFVTMESSYADRIDRCYSVDGQGFSEAAEQRFRRKYSTEEYDARVQKLYGVYGENDYVSPLGHSLVPKEHISYIRTPVEKENLAGYHDIKYLFATLTFDVAAGAYVTTFSGRKNEEVSKRGDLGNYAAALSDEVMELPVGERSGAAGVLMQLIEGFSGRKDGLNGEKLTWSDLMNFVTNGIPAIVTTTLGSGEGGRLLGQALFGDSFLRELPAGMLLAADYEALGREAGSLKGLAKETQRIGEELHGYAAQIPWYMLQKQLLSGHLQRISEDLQEFSVKMDQLSDQQEQIAENYAAADRQSMDLAAAVL